MNELEYPLNERITEKLLRCYYTVLNQWYGFSSPSDNKRNIMTPTILGICEVPPDEEIQ